jgi:hypothetical protein
MALPRNNDEVGSAGLYEAHWAEAESQVDTNLLRRDNLPCRAIMVTTSGVLVVVRPDGEEVTLPDAGAPVVWDIQAVALVAEGSDASGLVVYW